MTLNQARDRMVAAVREVPPLDLAVAGALAILGFFQSDSALMLAGVLLSTLPLAVRRTHPPISVVVPLAGAAMVFLAERLPVDWPLAVWISAAICFYTLLGMIDRRLAWVAGGLVTLLTLGLGASAWYYNREEIIPFLVALAVVAVVVTLLSDVRRSRTEVTRVRASNVETLREQAAMAERA
ncbi:MAG: hypothetical protein HOY71_05140, partial [Nonomuraea sp.]|nr:hypothetical protein [Nonomuraea sp.]